MMFCKAYLGRNQADAFALALLFTFNDLEHFRIFSFQVFIKEFALTSRENIRALYKKWVLYPNDDDDDDDDLQHQ